MNLARGTVAVALMSVLSFSISLSQSPWMYDNMSYSNGNLATVSSGTWFLGSGNPDFSVTSTNLVYPGYASDNTSGTGSVTMVNSNDQIAARSFGPTSANVYYSFIVNISSAPTAGMYFAALGDAGLTIPYGVVYVRENSGSLNFGVGRYAGGADTSWALGLFSKSTTHLIVVKYVFKGGLSDDSVYIYINPSPVGSEPSSADTSVQDFGGTSDPGDLQHVMIFENTTNGISGQFDAIRVASTWNYTPLPVQITAFNATTYRLDVNLHWSTATEINNFGFNVERRALGNDEGWQKVGFVQGSGTSTEPREYSYADAGLSAGRYAYRIKQIDMDGSFSYFTATEVEVGAAEKELALEPNFPNPFNPSTQISFTVPEDGKAVLKVYNMLGQEVAVLFDEFAQAGKLYQKTFNASSMPTGMYVYRLEHGGRATMRKMLFVK